MRQQFNEKNRDLIVNINGRLLHRDEAGVSPFDSAVQGGDAVWEGLRLYNGRIFKLDEHLERLRRSATALAFAEIPPNEELIEEIRRTLAANRMRDSVHIRLTLSRGVKITSGMDPRLNQSGPTLIVLAEHKPPVYNRSGLRLITSKMRRPPPEILDPQIHHANLLNSILAKIEANEAGADDALMLDLSGHIAETNATHLFLVRGGEVATSRVVACPEGITRATVLEICVAEGIPHEETDLTINDAYRAEEVFCTGTMGELAGVTRIDDRIVGSGAVGPMTQHLSELFTRRTSSEGVLVVEVVAEAGNSAPGRSACLTTAQPGLEIDLGPAEGDRDRAILFRLFGLFLELDVVDGRHIRFRLEVDRGDTKTAVRLFEFHFCARTDPFRRIARFFQA